MLRVIREMALFRSHGSQELADHIRQFGVDEPLAPQHVWALCGLGLLQASGMRVAEKRMARPDGETFKLQAWLCGGASAPCAFAPPALTTESPCLSLQRPIKAQLLIPCTALLEPLRSLGAHTPIKHTMAGAAALAELDSLIPPQYQFQSNERFQGLVDELSRGPAADMLEFLG